MAVSVRAATAADAGAIGRVHVRAWQAAYRGVMPDDYLDGLDEQERGQQWERRLTEPDPTWRTVVATVEQGVVGFATFGPARDQEAATSTGELLAINVAPERSGAGAGSALLGAVCADLARAGFSTAVLWVGVENLRARAFYEGRGWQLDDDAGHVEEILGVSVRVIRYRRSLEHGTGPNPAG